MKHVNTYTMQKSNKIYVYVPIYTVNNYNVRYIIYRHIQSYVNSVSTCLNNYVRVVQTWLCMNIYLCMQKVYF